MIIAGAGDDEKRIVWPRSERLHRSGERWQQFFVIARTTLSCMHQRAGTLWDNRVRSTMVMCVSKRFSFVQSQETNQYSRLHLQTKDSQEDRTASLLLPLLKEFHTHLAPQVFRPSLPVERRRRWNPGTCILRPPLVCFGGGRGLE